MSYSRGSSWDMSSSTPELSSQRRSFTFSSAASFTASFLASTASFTVASIASTASLLSIILLVIASSTDHWTEVKVDREEIARSHPPALDMDQIRYYNRNTGLFRICFPDFAQPTDGMYLSFSGELCTTSPSWTPPSISFDSTSPFSSSSSQTFYLLTPLLLVVSITLMSTSFLLSLSSCLSTSKCSTRFMSSAVFQLLGSAVAMTSMATWHIASFLHQVETQAEGESWRATEISVGWSYCVAWAGIALSLVASMVWFSAAFVQRNRRKLDQEGHNWCSPYHTSTSFNHNTPSCTAHTPRHIGESCDCRSVTCGALPCHESRPTSQTTNLPSHQLLPSQEMRLGCSHSCFSRSSSSLSGGETQMCNGVYRSCEGNQVSSSQGATSEVSSERQRTSQWMDDTENGNAADERNVRNQILARSRNESHPELIGDSKDFVEHSNKTISYEACETLDAQDSEEDLDRIDEALAEEDSTNYDSRIDETFNEKSDPLQDKREQLGSHRIEHCKRKISFREDWNTPGVLPYKKDVSNTEDLYNSRIELYNNEVSNSEDWYNSRIELYNNEVSESEDWDTSKLKHYNKMSISEEWDTSRLERYNKKMLNILNNTFNTMHSSDKYIREMLEF